MEDLAHIFTDKVLTDAENELRSIYYKAFRESKDKMEKIVKKITVNKNMTDQEIIKEWNKYNRLDEMCGLIAEDIKNANIEAIKLINRELVTVYSENYNFGAYTTERISGIKLNYTLYDKKVIQSILNSDENPFTLMSIEEGKDKAYIFRMLKRELAAAIIQGEGIQDIAARISKITGYNENRSTLIARTETTRVQNKARLDAFTYGADQGLKLKKKWVSTIDNRTRSSHQWLNGEERELDESFSNGLMNPGALGGAPKDICNCRCTVIVEFKGIEKTSKELELDAELKRMSYKEWAKN
ncbi:MAG: phage minor head protein [Clostridium sp.]|uniref:phage minor head protein n=1 Tax=Clostridium TaxID=1485 RepID=UPI003EE476DE